MKKLLIYLKPYRGYMALASLLMTVSVLCDLTLPTLMSRVLDRGVYLADQTNTFPVILQYCAQMLIIALVSLGSVLGGYWFATKAGSGFSRDLRDAIYQKIHTLSFEQVGKLGAAELVNRITHDAGTLSWLSQLLCGNIVILPMMFVGGVLLCLRKSLWLSLILLAAVPLVVVLVVWLSKKLMPLWIRSDEYSDRQNAIVRERLRGIRVIRAFDREDREHERISDATRIMADNIIKANVSMELVIPVITLLLNVVILLMVWVGGRQLETGSGLTAGDIFAVIQYVSIVLSSLIGASWALVMLPHARVAAGRIGQVMNAESIPEGEQEALTFSGRIDLEDVSFSYEGATEPTLSHITLHIAPGERISVIGGTGSGKSTLVSLLLAFRLPTQGQVLYDSRSTKDLARSTVRRNFSPVLQKSMIYAGTLRDNVALGNPDATEEELRQALEIAQLADFADRQEQGMDYAVTQAGGNLSGGQKQRLAIARAVVKDAPIYLFDDSFSALDFLTEARLRTALNQRFAGRTQIVITQRVTSAMRSDCIFVLDKGRLVGAGKHEDLLNTCRVYREIYASQTGGDRR